MNKNGSALIQLMIGTAIGSVIMGLLMTMLGQLLKVQKSAETLTQKTASLSVLNDVFLKDCSAIFVPIQAIKQLQKKVEKTTQATSVNGQQLKEEPQKESEQSQQIEPITAVFVYKQDQNVFSSLTFITAHRRLSMATDQNIPPKIHKARIVYTLKPDPQQAMSFMLMRQEDAQLDIKAYAPDSAKAPRAIMVTDHIKSIAASFGYETEKQKESSTTEQEQNKTIKTTTTKITKTFTTTNTWDSDVIMKAVAEKNKSPEVAKKLPNSPILNAVFFTIQLWNQAYTRFTTHKIVVPIIMQGFNQIALQSSVAAQNGLGHEEGTSNLKNGNMDEKAVQQPGLPTDMQVLPNQQTFIIKSGPQKGVKMVSDQHVKERQLMQPSGFKPFLIEIDPLKTTHFN